MKKIIIGIVLFIGVVFLLLEVSKRENEKRTLKNLSDESSFMQGGDLFLENGPYTDNGVDRLSEAIGTITKVVDEQRLIDNDFVGYQMEKGSIIYAYEDTDGTPIIGPVPRNFVVKTSSGKLYSYVLLARETTNKLLK